jgi:hypothetical protein
VGSAPFSVTHPELAAQWHLTRNGELTPAGVTPGSGRKVWWQCPKGHEWDDSPGHRTGRGSGCAVCAGKRIQIGVNDLASTHPAIAEQWHHARNGDLLPAGITAGSSKRFWWIDKFGHEWEAQVNNRTNGTGCPYCASRLVLAGFNDLATNRPDIAAEWHPARNGDLRPDTIAPQSNRKVWFRCRDGHEWLSTVNNRTTLGQGCPVCAGQKVLPGFNDLATTNPLLAAQWHPTRNAPLTPRDIFRSTAKRFWWVDVLGHEWEASANERSNGRDCPYCCGQRILVGFNDLATRMPELAAEWHPVKNSHRTPQMVTVMNGTRAWWLCANGHEWESIIANRSGGAGCPACAGVTVVPGVNDLATRMPNVASDWHPTRNAPLSPADITVYSNRKMWFQCQEGHEWESTVNNRSHGQGCPECAEGGGFNPGRPGYVYFLEHRGFGAYKVGITNLGTNRLTAFQLRGWQILALELFETGSHALVVERAVKRWWRSDMDLPAFLGPPDMPRTGGWSETIAADAVSAFECIDRIRAEAAVAREVPPGGIRQRPAARAAVARPTWTGTPRKRSPAC